MLLKFEDEILRVLESKENQLLVINCTQKSMPVWINKADLEEYTECLENELSPMLPDFEELLPEQKRIAHERYTMIAGVLPFLGDTRLRREVISRIASSKSISKQTLRRYLCRYLVYQNIAALAPKSKTKEEVLTQDQKNMRWALNKFFYTRHKYSLNTAYIMMLKNKYCDASGILLSDHPSIHQFRYFYRKHRKLQTYYISRDGLKSYQRKNRPLLGNGVQEFAPSVGTGMLDSTICDIYLVNESGNLVGRPILTACVDAYSGLCCGYSLSWEGGVYSLRNLMANVIADKAAWCRKFGISIQEEDWNCNQLPATLVTDMGNEYKSSNFEQIAELGVTVINLPPYRPELKGVVEKFFDLVQSLYKKQLKGKGIIEPDFQERGVRDYRKDACLTLNDFEKILLHCILYYNSKRTIERFPYSEDMIHNNILPTSSGIWNYGKQKNAANLISVSYETLMLSLLPRTTGKFTRYGLYVNQLRYKNDEFTEMYLKGDNVLVAYNPDDISVVWLIDRGIYKAFLLIESRFKAYSLAEVDSIKAGQKKLLQAQKRENKQAKIDLINHIEIIAKTEKNHQNIHIQDIRKTRKKEQSRTHISFMMDGGSNGKIE